MNGHVAAILEKIRVRRGLDFSWFRSSILLDRLACISGGGSSETVDTAELLDQESNMTSLLQSLYAGSNEFYRDPMFYKGLREFIFPSLEKKSHIKIFLPLAGGGGDLVSILSSVLQNFRGSYTLRASEYNPERIRLCKDPGLFFQETGAPVRYRKAGEREEFSKIPSLLQSRYQVPEQSGSPRAFSISGRYDLICIRNILASICDEVVEDFFFACREAVSPGGYLCLGYRESPRFLKELKQFEPVRGQAGLYRKAGA